MKLKAKEARATIVQRHLKFLKEAYVTMKNGDTMPRMLYIAMTYNLGWQTMAAARDLHIIRRHGWPWTWNAGPPTEKMALAVREWAAERSKGRPLSRRPKDRARYAELIGTTSKKMLHGEVHV